MDNPHVLASLARLHQNPDFIRFQEIYLDTLLSEEIQNCIEADDPARSQGGAQMLQRIKQDLKDAEDAFYKVTEQREIPLP